MTDFLSRLRQKKIAQWVFAYLAGAWVLLQVIDVVGDKFGWPAAVFRIATALLGAGFLAAVVLAWFHGERGEQKVGRVELVMLIGILVIAGAAVYAVRAPAAADAPAATADSEVSAKSIAVLPFLSMSADPENAYFASGIHDELLTRLSKIGDLRVISRTSVMTYAGTNKPLPQIGRELGVARILEGSVQRAGNRVKVQAQLIDAATDDHLWAQSYERDLTDVFAIQSEIAQAIAGAMQATLTAGEVAGMAQSPTANADAYDMFLRARNYQRDRGGGVAESLLAADKLYARAIELDPDFALAHAWRSYLNGWIAWLRLDTSPERWQTQLEAAQTALRLQPDLPEAHMAMGYYHYWAKRDYDRALAEFESALKDAPNASELLQAVAYVHRRQGKFDQAIKELEATTALDPRNGNIYQQLADTYHFMRRYDDALRAYNRALDLDPNDVSSRFGRADLYLDRYGTLDSLRAFALSVPQGDEIRADFAYARLSRDPAEALRAAELAPTVQSGYRAFMPRDLAIAWARRWGGDDAGARPHFQRALAVADSAIRTDSNDPRFHIARGVALAGLGRATDARAAARRAQQVMPASRDAWFARFVTEDAAMVLAQAGDADGAIPLIRELLSEPSNLSRNALQLDPIWDPIRGDPRFVELVGE